MLSLRDIPAVFKERVSDAFFFISDFCKRHKRTIAAVLVSFIILAFVLYDATLRAPEAFPAGEIITIEEGATLDDITQQLEHRRVVQNKSALKVIVKVFGGEKTIFAGDYFFKDKKNLFTVVWMITTGNFGQDPITVTIPEGVTNADIASIIARQISDFDTEKFLEAADGKEGYLFPNTYRFLPGIKPEAVVRTLERTFYREIAPLRSDILRFNKPLSEIVIMASLLEKEAGDTEVRRIISGILWKRIEIGMPLQVDATFLYINGKNTFQLTLDDLALDSPYNTYRNKGLPIGPIANPGLDSLLAAVTPIESDYIYYLADKEGITHYSRTFEEHKEKKVRYLR